MKKRISTLFLALISICTLSKADEVSLIQAQSLAGEFFGRGTNSPAVLGVTKSSTSDSPAFYIFNNSDGGWVIISAEDATYPVLAYNLEGAFRTDGMPDNLKSWLNTVDKEIKGVRKRGIRADEKVRAAWKNIGMRTKSGSGILIPTAEWDQDAPYNYFCPTIKENGKSVKTITGCVATAMAITLRHHMWPPQGKGTLESYSYTTDVDSKKTSIAGFSIESHNYNYNDMPLTAKEVKGLSSAKQQNLAQLLYDCGVMVKAEYNYETGTGAFSSDIVPALVKHMRYSGKAVELFRSGYGLDEWVSMLKAEIKADRPVIYSAQDPDEGGHQFVIDGYDQKDYMHVNWGWSGSGNGYFAIKYLSDGEFKFSDEQAGIFYLEPDREGGNTDLTPIIILESFGYSANGFSISGTVAKSETFKVSCAYLWNISTVDYNGAVKVALVDKYGKVKEYISSEIPVSIKGTDDGYYNYSLKNASCKFNCDTELGDILCLYYKLPSGDWKPVPYNKEDSYVGCYPIYDACFINVPDAFINGDAYTMELTRGQRAISSVKWYYDGSYNKNQQVVVKSGVHTIKAVIRFEDGGTETVVQEIQVN